MVDLVNDLLPKRKTDPTGWQPFARQLRAINLPMELVGNIARRAYIRQTTTVTPSRRAPATPRAAAAGSARRSLSWTPLIHRRSRMEHSMPTPPAERPRKAAAFVLRVQRHHHHQRVGPLLMARRREQPLREVYFDPRRVDSYGGVGALRRVTRVPR